MINSKQQLHMCLAEEKILYLPKESQLEWILTSDNRYKTYQYVRLLRITEYHYNNRLKLVHKLLYAWYRRRKNILGRKLGIEMWENTVDSGFCIYHPGNIVINGKARIGKNCKLHGSNCIGNNGKSTKAPVLGDNIRLGVGAKVIGDIRLADNITVAAGAVVIHSCLIPGAVLAGVPAKCVKVNSVVSSFLAGGYAINGGNGLEAEKISEEM